MWVGKGLEGEEKCMRKGRNMIALNWTGNHELEFAPVFERALFF